MKAKVICIASAKGGSGKTILTASLASFLEALGKKCLIIDCDAATHGMTLLYLSEVAKETTSKRGIFELSDPLDSKILEASLLKMENGVDLYPATYNFTAGFDPEENFNFNRMKEVIDFFREKYDYIFLDAQAGSDIYSRMAMSGKISDTVIIVSEYDPLSSAGVERLKQVMGEDLDPTRTWVLLNKMLPEFVDKFSEFLSIARYLPPIPWNADIVRAYAKRRLALDLEKGNLFTLSIMRVLNELLGDEIKEDIDNWKINKSMAIKEPLKIQFNHMTEELTLLYYQKNDIERKNRMKKSFFTALIPMSVAIFLVFFTSQVTSKGSIIELFKYLQENLSSVSLVVVMGVIVVLTSILSVLLDFLKRTSVVSIEERTIDRKIEVIEEKLKDLEIMQSADFESVVKNKIT